VRTTPFTVSANRIESAPGGAACSLDVGRIVSFGAVAVREAGQQCSTYDGWSHPGSESSACLACSWGMDPSITGLRVLRAVAELGSFTAAAQTLGYTQSAVSRQVAALERVTGIELFERHRTGVRLTPAGVTLLQHANTVVNEIDAAEQHLRGRAPADGAVRLGMYVSTGIALVPRALVALRQTHPQITVTTLEGTTPALVRALRAGTVDIALLSSRAPCRHPDGEDPPLIIEVLAERSLLIAVSATNPLAIHDSVVVADLRGQDWIASPASGGDTLLGVWPGVPGKPRIAHSARDWMTKLALVKAGLGITTVPATIAEVVPSGVKLLTVRDGPSEQRRTVLARLSSTPGAAVVELARALHAASNKEPL
jgi:DNA-binding transcriptional LysR family regulator